MQVTLADQIMQIISTFWICAVVPLRNEYGSTDSEALLGFDSV